MTDFFFLEIKDAEIPYSGCINDECIFINFK
jgi:hypothetical protein